MPPASARSDQSLWHRWHRRCRTFGPPPFLARPGWSDSALWVSPKVFRAFRAALHCGISGFRIRWIRESLSSRSRLLNGSRTVSTGRERPSVQTGMGAVSVRYPDRMLSRKLLTGAAVFLLSATFASPAVATPTVVDQYTEQIPTPAGESPDRSTPSRAARQPRRLGPGPTPVGNGRGTDFGFRCCQARLRAGTEGPAVSGAARLPTARPAGAVAGRRGRSLGREVFGRPAGSEAGLGAFFPLALLLIAGLVAAVVLTSRRNGPQPNTG